MPIPIFLEKKIGNILECIFNSWKWLKQVSGHRLLTEKKEMLMRRFQICRRNTNLISTKVCRLEYKTPEQVLSCVKSKRSIWARIKNVLFQCNIVAFCAHICLKLLNQNYIHLYYNAFEFHLKFAINRMQMYGGSIVISETKELIKLLFRNNLYV